MSQPASLDRRHAGPSADVVSRTAGCGAATRFTHSVTLHKGRIGVDFAVAADELSREPGV